MPRAIGQLTTTSVSKVPIEATTYTEQTSGAQRSVKSSSASDSAAGTGVRTMKIIYYTLAADGTITGPKSEVVTMNGTTAVVTVATDIALVESMVPLTVGSGGTAAGTISLYANTLGTSTVIGSIATGDTMTRWAHHYVPSNKTTEITDIECIGGDATIALVEIDKVAYPLAAEVPVTGQYGTTSALPRGVEFDDHAHAIISGPARVRAQVTPGNTDSQLTVCSFGFVDRTRVGVI